MSHNDEEQYLDAEPIPDGPDAELADEPTEHDGGSPSTNSEDELDGGEVSDAVVGRRNEDLPMEIRKPL